MSIWPQRPQRHLAVHQAGEAREGGLHPQQRNQPQHQRHARRRRRLELYRDADGVPQAMSGLVIAHNTKALSRPSRQQHASEGNAAQQWCSSQPATPRARARTWRMWRCRQSGKSTSSAIAAISSRPLHHSGASPPGHAWSAITSATSLISARPLRVSNCVVQAVWLVHAV